MRRGPYYQYLKNPDIPVPASTLRARANGPIIDDADNDEHVEVSWFL
jgi:hypothetical protein